jgi:hypothetical protein
MLNELPYAVRRDYNPEDTIRFYGGSETQRSVALRIARNTRFVAALGAVCDYIADFARSQFLRLGGKLRIASILRYKELFGCCR